LALWLGFEPLQTTANHRKPILIVGGGLAGTALAWRLHERGARFLMVDPQSDQTCSKIAAGLVTPITGRRVRPSWRVDEFLPAALDLYHSVEKNLGQKFYHERPLVRLFAEPREADWWRGRLGDPALQQWVESGARLVDAAQFHVGHGGFVQRQSGWLDTKSYLEASRAFFDSLGFWRRGIVNEDELELSGDGVRWKGADFSHAVLCRGADQRSGSKYFSWLSFGCARGVVASLKIELREDRIVNRGCWLLPRESGQWRAGSTYEFDLETSMESSLAELRGKLSQLLKTSFEFTGAQAGIRPIIKHRQLLLGPHPSHPRLCIFNGLGSKGVLRAPFFACMLAEHLLDDKPIGPDVDVRAND
jgi:glycine/D-amino acid oxidase-like deaminating enzyme